MTFSVAPGVLDALADADDPRAHYLLTGDLSQMGTMYTALKSAGFRVVKRDVYPGFAESDEEEYVRALRFVYESGIAGWWNQRTDIIKHGIATAEEFQAKLSRAVRRSQG